MITGPCLRQSASRCHGQPLLLVNWGGGMPGPTQQDYQQKLIHKPDAILAVPSTSSIRLLKNNHMHNTIRHNRNIYIVHSDQLSSQIWGTAVFCMEIEGICLCNSARCQRCWKSLLSYKLLCSAVSSLDYSCRAIHTAWHRWVLLTAANLIYYHAILSYWKNP